MDYDFAIIGGGSAGYAAARTAAGLGLKTCVIEGGKEVGGLCILRGCMPSKTLIESANRFLTLRHAGEFGLSAGSVGYDGTAIIARKRRLIAEFANYRQEQLATGKFAFLRGMAAFRDAQTVMVREVDGGEQTVSARSFLICTGSTISWPPIEGLADAGCLTSDDVLEKPDIPASIIVLGGGPVGLEMAHYFGALGAKVSIVQRGKQLLSGVDEDLARVVEEAFRRRGFDIFTGTKLRRVEHFDGKRRVVFEHAGKEVTIEAEEILNSLGRTPNVAGLDLPKAGVALEKKSVGVNSHQQTSRPHIFAAGDCCGPYEIVHLAVAQGELAARNAARMLRGEGGLESMDYRLKLFVVFTEPQVATVGLSENEAAEKKLAVRTAAHPFDDHGKSQVMNETDGFVKLMADTKTGEILGGAVVGPHASDLIHEIAVAMNFHATARQLAAIPHYHPTLSEIWTYPAEELAEIP